MMTWYTFPKQEGNNCKECRGTGKIQWFDIDGTTIYHWMKPNVKDCDCQKEKSNG
jgi:RecJ-like exonuclease